MRANALPEKHSNDGQKKRVIVAPGIGASGVTLLRADGSAWTKTQRAVCLYSLADGLDVLSIYKRNDKKESKQRLHVFAD